MNKIKIVGVLIFILSISLAFLSSYISDKNKRNSDFLNSINKQKAFTQEIAKNIFYIYKNKDSSTAQLDRSIKKFINNKKIVINIDSSKNIQNKNKEIIVLWNKFYLLVEKFRVNSKTISTYSHILIEKLVNNIYKTNIRLVVNFDEIIKIYIINFNEQLNTYKTLQYTLFFILVTLLIYLFTQLQSIIIFIQKFRYTSQNIISNSTIKELEPINIQNNSNEMLEISNNFNFLVEKINNSIKSSSNSIEHSYKSLQHVETHVEDLLELIDVMDDGKIDKELTKKEDAIIQSLEELTSSAEYLKNLQKNLDDLISQHKSK